MQYERPLVVSHAPVKMMPAPTYKAESTNLLALAAIATTYVNDNSRGRVPSGTDESGDETDVYSSSDSDTDTATLNDGGSASPSPPPSKPSNRTTVTPPMNIALPPTVVQHLPPPPQHQSMMPPLPPQPQGIPRYVQQPYVLIPPPAKSPEIYYSTQPIVMAPSTSEKCISSDEVSRWMKYAPVNGQKLWKCLKCKRDYKTKYVCKRHVEAHLVHKPFGCQNCSRRFQRLDQLQRHRKKILKCKAPRVISRMPVQPIQPQPVHQGTVFPPM
jgi:hypothetical protein